MPELGNKHECHNCGGKFYDLGKPEAICPKCGANQKDARPRPPVAEAPAARRKRRDIVDPEIDDKKSDPLSAADDDLGADDLVKPEAVLDEDDSDDD